MATILAKATSVDGEVSVADSAGDPQRHQAAAAAALGDHRDQWHDTDLRPGSRDIEHIGSVHTDADLELLKAVARQRLAAGQGELDLRLPDGPANGGGPLPITSTRAGHLLDALGRGYDALGFAAAAERDEVFKALVLAMIIEPTSKLDSVRVLDEAGAWAPSYATIKRRLGAYATGGKASAAGGKTEGVPVEGDAEPTFDPAGGPWRARLARACAAHVSLGPATPTRG